MSPQEFVNFWDSYILRWYEDMAQHHDRSLEVWDNFFKEYPFDISELILYRYFPEPYFGNPLSKDLRAVFINLNPGRGGKEQDFRPIGDAISLFRGSSSSYFKLMGVLIHYSRKKKFDSFFGPTLRWWDDNRVRWINEVFGAHDEAPATLDNIVGLELTPWHTRSFGEIASTMNGKQVANYVFKPAAVMSKQIKNRYLCEGEKSIVIGRGLQGVLAVRDLVRFEPCVTPLPARIEEKWSVRRGVLDDQTILIDFSRKRGGFGMKFPVHPELSPFFESELQSL
jgi:hypothetical protein